jgi:hypothetical protein
MTVHLTVRYEPQFECFQALFLRPDIEPTIAIERWRSVTVERRGNQIGLEPAWGELAPAPGSYLGFALLFPVIRVGAKKTFPITWHRTGLVDASWWNDAWRSFDRSPPRFGPAFCLCGAGPIPPPPAGQVLEEAG